MGVMMEDYIVGICNKIHVSFLYQFQNFPSFLFLDDFPIYVVFTNEYKFNRIDQVYVAQIPLKNRIFMVMVVGIS